MDHKSLYLDIDSMRVLLNPDAYRAYMYDMLHSVNVILNANGTYQYVLYDSYCDNIIRTFASTKELNDYYSKGCEFINES